jgi:Mg-chelatase subunit ChlD
VGLFFYFLREVAPQGLARHPATQRIQLARNSRHCCACLPASLCLQGELLTQDAESRRTIVLITDGKPTDREDALAAAERARSYGIKMVVVGAGEIDYDTLKALASGPQFVFANFELDAGQLLKLADLASQGVCRELD